MTEPSMELDASLSSAPTTYDQAIINANTVDTTKVIRWGDEDSADGAITNVTLPTSGNKWAPELWLEDTDGVDVLVCDSDEEPDAAVQREMMFKLTSDAVAYATAPRITAYDSNAHASTAEEVFTGTTNHTSPFLKARGQTVTTAPPQYWGEAGDSTLHAKDTTGAITCGDATGNQENAVLEGDTNYLVASATNINTTPQYFSLALSVPDDATPGVDAIDIVLSVRYTYT
jgi:hypothetical protein